jgi:hypothetical protein
MSEIKTELMKAANAKEKKGEDFQAFAKRLTGLVQALPDDSWDKLSKNAQDWVNEAATAINAKKDIPNIDDAEDEKGEGEDADADTGEEEEVATSKKSAKNGKKGAASKKGATTATKNGNGKNAKAGASSKKDDEPMATTKKEAAKPATRSSGKGGAQVAIKTAVIKDPKATTESIVNALKKKGLEPTIAAVSTIRSGTLQTLRLVKDLGMPKGDI